MPNRIVMGLKVFSKERWIIYSWVKKCFLSRSGNITTKTWEVTVVVDWKTYRNVKFFLDFFKYKTRIWITCMLLNANWACLRSYVEQFGSCHGFFCHFVWWFRGFRNNWDHRESSGEILLLILGRPLPHSDIGQVFDISLCLCLDSTFLEAVLNKIRIVLAVFVLG